MHELSWVADDLVLRYPMCRSAPDIVQFVRQFTVHRPGVGHICSLSAFDFRRHGNSKYGAPVSARKPAGTEFARKVHGGGIYLRTFTLACCFISSISQPTPL